MQDQSLNTSSDHDNPLGTPENSIPQADSAVASSNSQLTGPIPIPNLGPTDTVEPEAVGASTDTAIAGAVAKTVLTEGVVNADQAITEETTAAPSIVPNETEGRLDEHNARKFVEDWFDRQGYICRFDGAYQRKGEVTRADTPEMIDAQLDAEPVDFQDLQDKLILFVHAEKYDHKKSVLTSALRRVVKSRRHQRRKQVLKPLLKWAPGTGDLDRARGEWNRLATIFDMGGDLAVGVLAHFIWQVKRKAIGQPVIHHLMPIIFSSIQGSGKSTFVTKFLAPLEELVSHGTLISDLADKRSGDIFGFPVLVLDDMECLEQSKIPVLKNMLTTESIRRRKLGTSTSSAIRQSASPIGTANQSVNELINDETGHRRFAVMPFRNGQADRGGDTDVWKTVASVDYMLLWQAVDPFRSSPILPQFKDLVRHQAGTRPTDGFVVWLRQLDFDSIALRNITTIHGVRAQGLRELYTAQTGVTITPNRFSELMDRYLFEPECPFADKVKITAGYIYRRRPMPQGLPN